ncbi:MAG: hypothetical protein E6J34_23790 [Chloroflexi bacterium]|nr:MAG: hypothetical protein E6J34_23790 [Chloroflexota bacterium]
MAKRGGVVLWAREQRKRGPLHEPKKRPACRCCPEHPSSTDIVLADPNGCAGRMISLGGGVV